VGTCWFKGKVLAYIVSHIWLYPVQMFLLAFYIPYLLQDKNLLCHIPFVVKNCPVPSSLWELRLLQSVRWKFGEFWNVYPYRLVVAGILEEHSASIFTVIQVQEGCLTLKKAVYCSEMLVTVYQLKWHKIPEDLYLNFYDCCMAVVPKVGSVDTFL
jgi:hypothetical protein